MTSRWPLALVLAVTLACRSASPIAPAQAPPPPSPAPAAAPPAPAAFRAPEAIRWSRDSAEHRALFLQVYRIATAHVEREAATRAAGSWAVVLDADETVIDNSTYQLERAQAGRPFDSASWRAWTARREATPLPGAAAFLSRVRALGGKIAIVTNRTATECPDTEAVFQALGSPTTRCCASPARDRATRTRGSRRWRAARRPRGCPPRGGGLRRRQHPGLPRPEPGAPQGAGRGLRALRRAVLRPAEPDVRQLGEQLGPYSSTRWLTSPVCLSFRMILRRPSGIRSSLMSQCRGSYSTWTERPPPPPPRASRRGRPAPTASSRSSGSTRP